MAVFHSISAFCNAGIDLMGIRIPFSSLTLYAANPLVNLVIMALIIIGGIGFLTWEDIRSNHLHFSRYRMQSKVILTTTAILILLPALYFYFGEFRQGGFGTRILLSLFQSVTPRTAGFNTADFSKLTESGQMLTIILTATLASIGTAGVPGAGMVMLAMVLTSVGLPVDGIALVAGVDRIFDMGRTVVNITGDASCCVVVHNLEKKKEMKNN